MATNPSIQDLLNQLGSMSYSAPSGYKGYQSGIKSPIGYKKVDGSGDWGLTQDDFKSLGIKDKKGNGINLWDVLSGTLGQAGGIVTDTMYDQISSLKDKDKSTGRKAFDFLIGNSFGTTMLEGLGAGAKKQWENWTDGDLSWGDIPLVGVLNGADKNYKRGTDIAQDHIGIDNRWGKVGAGIGIDIAADPLTYMTGGLSVASKLKKAAELAEISNQAKKLGVVGNFKNADDLLNVAKSTFQAKYAKYPNLADKMVNKKLAEITEQIKTAGNNAFNQNINKVGFKAPFMNKYALADKSKKSLTYRTEATLGSQYRHLAEDLMKNSGLDSGAFNQILKLRYGVDDVADLTKTQYEDLHSKLSPLVDKFNNLKGMPDADITQKIVEKSMPLGSFMKLMDKFTSDNVKWKDVQKQLDEILSQTAHDPKLRSSIGSHLAEMVSKYWENAPIKNFNKVANQRKAESMNWASRFLKDSDTVKEVKTSANVFKNGKAETLANKHQRNVTNTLDDLIKNPYNEMSNARTKFEHFLDKKNPFDARTLATGDKFLDSMANHIADGNSQRIGETAMFTKGLSELDKFVKKNNITDKEMNEAIYVLEKQAPDSYGQNWTPSANVEKLANMIKPIINDIAENEKGSVLTNLRENYFPHVVNASEDKLKNIQDFMSRHPELNGLKSTSNFDKSRTGFQTLAERDNYLEKLEKAIQKTTDSDTIESLRKQQEEIANLFDTNVVSALQRRVREGVRAKSMKAMQGELSKYGMMKTLKKGEAPPVGLTKLDSETTKKLGLGEGQHYIHEKVLDGMKRIDEIFTNQGMNKVVRSLSAISDIWRPLVTYYKPSHYLNNIIGNSIINVAAGVTVRDYKTAGKLLHGYRKGTLTDDQMKIMKAAYKHNVISGGFLFDSKPTFEFDNPTGIENLAKKIGDNKSIKWVREKGERIDDISRLANFVNGIGKYGKSEKAAAQVREYLFNYNELTNADRGMRVVVPFWNWTKRNIPLQMKLLMENPKFAMNIERVKELFNKDQEGADWQKESGIKVPNTNYYTSVPSPTSDLDLLLNPKGFLGSLNPAVKIPIEMSVNKKLYTNKPISYGSDSVQPEDLLPYLISNMGIGKNAYDAFGDKQTAGESLINLLRPITKINNGGGN